MSWEEWERLEKLNKEYLDTLDLNRYINASKDVDKIMDMIRDDYDDEDCLPPELEGSIFNHLDTEEVANYLANRYGKRVHEHVIYEYTLY